LLGLSYANTHDAHIRVDLVRGRLKPRHQAWIELYGILLLLLPFAGLVLFYAFPFVYYSFVTGEVSEAPGGLPYRWAIKSFLLLGFALLMLSSLARLSRVWRFLFGEST
jgi:TRAP-type mannitol/chloroaromatic compound transport system permease small subunit